MTTSSDRPHPRGKAVILVASLVLAHLLGQPGDHPSPIGPRPASAQILSHCTAAPKPSVNWLRCFFNERNFSGVDLTGAVIRESSFNRAIFKKAILTGVDAREARLFRADLSGANLTGARLDGADLFMAVLDDATWTDGSRCAPGSRGLCRR